MVDTTGHSAVAPAGEPAAASGRQETSPHRQVILVITDTTRWDMLGCYRDTGLRTPYLDELAAAGARFQRAYTCDPVCAPARSAMLTGLWPHSNGVWANNQALESNAKTIGEHLQGAGISAGYVGKWHLDGTDYFGDGRCPAGWDPRYWYDGRNHLEWLSETDRQRSRDPATNYVDDFAEQTFARRCTELGSKFIADHADGDFLLVVSYDEPHHPSISPKGYAEEYRDYVFPASPNSRDSLDDKPHHHRVWAEGGGDSERFTDGFSDPEFFGSQTFVDSEIGHLLASAKAVVPDAMVIYTSDHGSALGAHRLVSKGPAMYDEIARVPLLISWPGRIPGGCRVERPVSHIDLAPTILAALGVPVPPIISGRSLVPATGDPAARDALIFCEYGRYEVDHDGFGGFQPMRGAFDGRYKLVLNLLSSDELYDLGTDPDELHNMIDDPGFADIRDSLHDRILAWMDDTRDPFRGYYWRIRPWRTDADPASWHTGVMRQRPDNGHQPTVLRYMDGQEIHDPVVVLDGPEPST